MSNTELVEFTRTAQYMSPGDAFYAIGFTGKHILKGTRIRVMELSTRNLRRMAELNQQFGPLARAVSSGLLDRELVEVYFLSPFDSPRTEEIVEQYGGDYHTIEFFNETALTFCKEYGITLPPIIEETTRAQLPDQYGITMRFPTYTPRKSRLRDADAVAVD
jgi:hypothetical protein